MATKAEKRIWNAADWIWAEPAPSTMNDYQDFRRVFRLETPASGGTLRIAAIGDFAAWIDGTPVGHGQFSDYPDAPTFFEFAIPGEFTAGEHVLAVTGYRRGANFSTFRDGPSGLCVLLELGEARIASDATWRACRNRCYRSGEIERVTLQLGFVMEYDARQEDRWQFAEYDDAAWAFAVPVERPVPIARPIPPLDEGERICGTVVMQGFLTRPPQPAGTFADAVRSSSLRLAPPGQLFGGTGEFGNELPRLDGVRTFELPVPALPENGTWLTVDLGGELLGLLEFELEAPAGAILDLSHGEHLADGRVRAKIGGRNFTDRYHCREGRNHFTFPFRRLGCRYLELQVTAASAPVKIRYLGMRPLTLPLPAESEFDNGDRQVEQLRRTALRTLRLCMHEHYEDCPWREQSLYAYDSRNQALFGYYAWGNWSFAQTSFELLGRGIRPDWELELCAPARCGVTIPVFSLAWMVAAEEAGRYSGNDGLFGKFAPQMAAMLEHHLSRMDPALGLCRTPEGKSIWNFYEWAPGLDGGEPSSPTHFSALYNLYLLLALRACGAMEQRVRGVSTFETAARELAAAIHRIFYDSRSGCYRTFLDGTVLSGLHEHTNALALLLKLPESGEEPAILRAFLDSRLAPAGISPLPFLIDALMEQGPEARAFVSERITKTFSAMLNRGGDTLWETPRGERDFDGAGSLCHAWSSVSVYFNGAYELGVRPLEPGFRTFRISPYPGARHLVSGTVPTPYGRIRVQATTIAGEVELHIVTPPECVPELRPYPEFPVVRCSVAKEYSASTDSPNRWPPKRS